MMCYDRLYHIRGIRVFQCRAIGYSLGLLIIHVFSWGFAGLGWSVVSAGENRDAGLIETMCARSRFKAVRKLDDPAALAVIALEDRDWAVRFAAVDQLDQPSILERVVLQDPDWYVRRRAVTALENQSLLAMVAVEDESRQVRQAATARLADQKLLAGIARDDACPEVRLAAVQELDEQVGLEMIAVADEAWQVRLAAVSKLADQAKLAAIARADGSARVRRAAVAGLREQAGLGRLALEDEDAGVRAEAAAGLKDQAILARLAVEDEDAEVRRIAFTRLDDEEMIVGMLDQIGYEMVKKLDQAGVADAGLASLARTSPVARLDCAEDVFPESRRERWQGPEATQAGIYLGWNDDKFKLLVVVGDDRHFNSREGADIWNGDAVQIAFAPEFSDPYSLGLALAAGRVQAHQYHGPEVIPFDDLEFSIERDEVRAITTYQIAIPFKYLNIEPVAGTRFGFNLVVFNDDDGEGYDYWLQMSHGLAGGWSPVQFRQMILWD